MKKHELIQGEGVVGMNRRKVLKLGAGIAAVSALGMPAIVSAQAAAIKIGHLTPKTGFLGALGEWATLGIQMAVEEVNAEGGIKGRMIEMQSEDSINPDTAATKAQRMIERDKVDFLIGEISSASALAISQVAARNEKLFVAVGPRSDILRDARCNKYMFCTDIPNTAMVNAVGSSIKRQGLVDGKKFMTLTADYVFGADLLKAAKAFFDANNAELIADEKVATDVTDFSPFLIKVRQNKPDVVCLNLAGSQVTNFVKQYSEFGLPYPTVGFNLNTADAWAAGLGNLSGTWPTPWYHTLDNPESKAFVAAFQAKYNKLPENHSWISYIAMKIMAQSMTDTESSASSDLIAHLESEAKFDILKGRKAYFRSWDHQLVQEAYAFSVDDSAANEYDMIKLGAAVPGADQALESIYPTKAHSSCKI